MERRTKMESDTEAMATQDGELLGIYNLRRRASSVRAFSLLPGHVTVQTRQQDRLDFP